MPYTITFPDRKLYQSLSFDADIKFPQLSEYTKKFWVLREYQKTGAEAFLSKAKEKDNKVKTFSSFSIEKSFEDDELVVELVENIKFFDDFDYFAKAEIEETGDEELDALLNEVKLSDFNKRKIIDAFGIKADTEFFDFKEEEDCQKECEEDCSCDCSESE
tara:strand:- start:867 stop:1349 length:483 start_codon:yes stop_codon:yes gene_type:complete